MILDVKSGYHGYLRKLGMSNIGSDNGLSPGRRQAIIWTNSGMILKMTWTYLSVFQLREVRHNIPENTV